MKLKNKELFIEKCLIGSKWLDANNKKIIKVDNPFDGKIIGNVPNMGKQETTKAILQAHKALDSWKSQLARSRSELLEKWYDLIIKNIDDLATIMTIEQGKPLAEAKTEIKYAASFVKWFSAESQRIYGTIIPSHLKNSKIMVTKEAIGVCAAITPWNFPAAMITRKIAPALGAGCTVIVKPASQTPFTALALIKLAQDAGFPDGVINIVTGSAKEIGKELSTNKIVKKLSFTGSTEVGKVLMKQCASNIKKLSLELGGNAPFIVFDDANIDAAIDGLMASKFRNSGQTCISVNRVYLEDKIHDDFIKKLSDKITKLKQGNGIEKDTDLGPLINKDAILKIEQLIDDAVKKGGKIICGGVVDKKAKNFFKPTIIIGIKKNMKIFKEEIFGPVIAITKFKSEEQAIDLANNTQYGLASYFYSKNLTRSIKISEKLEYGMVGVNNCQISTCLAPFGGTKESGLGREGSFMGIEEYVETKYILLGFSN